MNFPVILKLNGNSLKMKFAARFSKSRAEKEKRQRQDLEKTLKLTEKKLHTEENERGKISALTINVKENW